MAKPQGDLRNMLLRLEQALKLAKPKDVVSAAPMAQIVGLSWRHLLDHWIESDPQFPIKTRGNAGKGYEFEVVKVLRHLKKRCEERIRKQDADARRILELTNIPLPEADGGAPGTMLELRQAIEASAALQRLKIAQGEYVPRAQVEAFIRDYNELVLSALIGAAAKLDPTGQWPVGARAAFEQDMRTLAAAVTQRVDAFIEGFRVEDTPERGRNVRGRGGAGRGRILPPTG